MIKTIKDFLLEKRNKDNANMEYEAEWNDGYFNPESYSGGNFDDCYQMGKNNGEAELIEELLKIIN